MSARHIEIVTDGTRKGSTLLLDGEPERVVRHSSSVKTTRDGRVVNVVLWLPPAANEKWAQE